MTASIPSKASSRRTTGMPPPPHRDDELPGLQERAHGRELEHLQRPGGGDDAPPAPARLLLQRPAALALELPGTKAVVVGADRLGRVLEGGIGGVDHNVCDHDRHRPPYDGDELGCSESPDLGLRLRDRDPERERRRLGSGELLAEELVPDLRAVPVRDHDLALEQRRDRRERPGEVRPVLGSGPPLPGPEKRVPAERDHRQHGADRAERLCFTSTRKAMAASARAEASFGTARGRSSLCAWNTSMGLDGEWTLAGYVSAAADSMIPRPARREASVGSPSSCRR